jgi:hypothetical protein
VQHHAHGVHHQTASPEGDHDTDETATDLQSLTTLSGSIDGFMTASIPPSPHQVVDHSRATMSGNLMSVSLVGTTLPPPTPPPRG